MPPRGDGSRRKVTADRPLIQFSRTRTSWPSARRIRQLQSSDFLANSISKTGLGATTHPAHIHLGSQKKSKPFSFALQPPKEFPWSRKTFLDDHSHVARSYEKSDKRAYRLPVDPLSRLVWDEQVVPPVEASLNYKVSDNNSTSYKDSSTPNINIGDRRRHAPPTTTVGTLLPYLQGDPTSRKLPFNLLKYAKKAAKAAKAAKANKGSAPNDSAPKNWTNEKLQDSGYGSLAAEKTSRTTTFPEVKDIERYRKPQPACVSRYHANCYDSDDDLDSSWTLPRIETVLKSEGVEPGSIMHQIEKIRTRKSRVTSGRHERSQSWETAQSEPVFHLTIPHLPVLPTSASRALVTSGRHERSQSWETARSEPVFHHTIPYLPVLPTSASGSASRALEYDNERRLKLKQILSHRRLAEEIKTADGEMLPSLTDDPGSKTREAIQQYFKDIENIRWMSQQQIERGLVSRDFPVPRVLLISSQVPEASGLLGITRNDTILPILYDYNDETFGGILKGIRLRLDEYREEYNMRSLLLYSQGGPGYIYFLRKKVITRQKMEGDKNKDMSKFFNDLGCMVSKLDTKEAFVHMAGPVYDHNHISRTQFMSTLEEKVKPNIVHFEMLDEEEEQGKEILSLYFDLEKYQKWKSKTNGDPDEQNDQEES